MHEASVTGLLIYSVTIRLPRAAEIVFWSHIVLHLIERCTTLSSWFTPVKFTKNSPLMTAYCPGQTRICPAVGLLEGGAGLN